METNPYQTPAEQQVLPPSHSVYGPYRDTRGLGKVVVVLLTVDIFISVLVSATSYQYSSLIGTQNWAQIESFETVYTASASLQLLVYLATVVFFAIWINRSMKNAWAVRQGQHLMTPAWAVGWYFIPIAHLWKPLEGMKQIRDAAFGSSQGLSLAPWWTCWLLANFGANISGKLPTETLGELQSSLMFDVFLGLIEILSAVFALLVVKKITHKQHEVANFIPQ